MRPGEGPQGHGRRSQSGLLCCPARPSAAAPAAPARPPRRPRTRRGHGRTAGASGCQRPAAPGRAHPHGAARARNKGGGGGDRRCACVCVRGWRGGVQGTRLLTGICLLIEDCGLIIQPVPRRRRHRRRRRTQGRRRRRGGRRRGHHTLPCSERLRQDNVAEPARSPESQCVRRGASASQGLLFIARVTYAAAPTNHSPATAGPPAQRGTGRGGGGGLPALPLADVTSRRPAPV